jgi:hypothetical protein
MLLDDCSILWHELLSLGGHPDLRGETDQRQIERTAPPGHFELVSDIYGPEWLEPFAGILGSV